MSNYESLPRSFNFAPANVSLTGLASAVSGASWPLVANAAGDNLAHKITVQNGSANDKSSIAIAIVGTDANGAAQSETLTGPVGSATVTSAKFYLTVTSVTPASTWGADTANIGWAASFVSSYINVNYLAEDILTLLATVTGTINFTINQTMDRVDQGAVPTWSAVASGQTATGTWQTIGGAVAVQFIANSYSNGAAVKLNANATFVANAEAPGSDVDLASVGGTPITIGQALAAASLPVVPASDYYPAPYSYSRKTADGQVKGAAGTLHTLAISPTGTVTAGVLTIYDSTTESGTVLFSVSLPITTFATIVLPLDVAFGTGLYVGFDATLANVQVLASYR